MKISGTTGWRSYINEEDDSEILKSELIITIESDRSWANTDAPRWFVAIPSDIDDPKGTRDYIVIKGQFLIGKDP